MSEKAVAVVHFTTQRHNCNAIRTDTSVNVFERADTAKKWLDVFGVVVEAEERTCFQRREHAEAARDARLLLTATGQGPLNEDR